MERISRSITYLALSQTVGSDICFFFFHPLFLLVNQNPSLKGRGDSQLMNSQDVVSEYSYGHSEHLLEKDDFGPDYVDAYVEVPKASGLLKQMYWIFQLMQSLPEWSATLISPSFGLIVKLRHV